MKKDVRGQTASLHFLGKFSMVKKEQQRRYDMDTQRTAQLHHELAEEVREQVRAQRDIWKEIPNLAHWANGRDGWSGTYTRASRYGIWQIPEPQRPAHSLISVHCLAGEIHFTHVNGRPPASDSAIVQHAHMLLQPSERSYFDAEAIAQRLRDEMTAPRPSWMGREEFIRNAERRWDEARCFGIAGTMPSRVFRRKAAA
jgi:hypothetical protein